MLAKILEGLVSAVSEPIFCDSVFVLKQFSSSAILAAQPKAITSFATLSAEVAVPRILAPPDLVLETALSASGDEKREEIRQLLGARREAVRRTRAFPV